MHHIILPVVQRCYNTLYILTLFEDLQIFVWTRNHTVLLLSEYVDDLAGLSKPFIQYSS